MGIFFRTTVCALALVLFSSIARADDLYLGGFEGTWQGRLKTQRLDLKTYDLKGDPAEFETRITIKKNKARVYNKTKEGGWSEVRQDPFTIAIHKTNAVVSANDSSHDKTGADGWVETWNFTLTHKDNKTLYVAWVRAVNNYRRKFDETSDARFFFTGFGEITRID